jgi:crossover junction endodeoxyribonuclease RusA
MILNPNARPHWRAKAACAKVYRTQAWYLTKAAHIESNALTVGIVFRPPDKRRRDLDNCLASFKAALDGIADALGVNDNQFKLTVQMGQPIKGGIVEVTL